MPLAQLGIQLSRCRFAPQFNLAQSHLVDDSNTGKQCTHQTVYKFGLGQLENIADPEVLQVTFVRQLKVFEIKRQIGLCNGLQ